MLVDERGSFNKVIVDDNSHLINIQNFGGETTNTEVMKVETNYMLIDEEVQVNEVKAEEIYYILNIDESEGRTKNTENILSRENDVLSRIQKERSRIDFRSKGIVKIS